MEFGLKNIIFLVVFFGAAAFFTKNVLKLVSYLKLGKPDNRFDRIGERMMQTLVVAIAQKKILRDKQAGPLHAGIFWGFLILLFSVLNSIFAGFGIHNVFSFLGPVYSIITLLTDIFIVLIMFAVTISFLRRYVMKVPRLQKQGKAKQSAEAGLILLAIFLIVSSLLFENASLFAMGKNVSWEFRPVSSAIGSILPLGAAAVIFDVAWWMHIVLILAFMNALPYSKHLHVLTSVPNVFFSKLGKVNKLERIDFEDPSAEKFGVTDIEDFSWKTLHDSYTCTECGRCTSVCPANQTGKVLDPREIMIQIRKRTLDRAPILVKQKAEIEKAAAENREAAEVILTEAEQEIMGKKLIGDYVNPEALWQCTTCSACMEECPVNIEHVPAIVDMRRSLVMMEADFPAQLGGAFTNIENNASPWAFPPDARAEWKEGLEVSEAMEKPDFDILFWVGCAGSFDERAKSITRSFASLMNIAGINFAILGREEVCNGDPARRGGNEYLADMYVKMNIETMGRYNVKKIVATCPHCLNTLKNEYPQFGGEYEVVHHTEFLDGLIREGRIPVSKDTRTALDITYHDSCYLGRLNGIYDKPRSLIKGLPGMKVIEPSRSKDKGFCCGAGGAQMFMEETVGKRVNIERTEELLATGAKTIALNCPFCLTMITDGVKAKEMADEVKVKDIAELILESIQG